MEGDKRQGNSSSSITADLFGTKQPAPSSSAGIFSTIFSHPSKMGTGRKPSSSEVTGSRPKQLPDGVQAGNTKPGSSVSEGANSNICNKNRSSAFHEERAEPCHLSSSLYYGGQEVYSPNPTTYTNRSYPVYKKDGDTGDSNGNNSQGASRGNWWEGSLYY